VIRDCGGAVTAVVEACGIQRSALFSSNRFVKRKIADAADGGNDLKVQTAKKLQA
jgi:hypothetical protein